MIPDDIAKLADWIPKKRYLDLYKESDEAIKKRIQKGFWKAGKQYSRPAGGGLWISIKGVNAWAAAHTPEASGSAPAQDGEA